MPQASWQAARGSYQIDLIVGNRGIQAMIDLGLVDPLDLVGIELQPAVYDGLKQSGQIVRYLRRSHRVATGVRVAAESGLTTAQLVDPLSQHPIGPLVQLYVTRGAVGVQSRVGVVFFHRLSGCRVSWDLDARTWTIEYP